MPTYSFKAVDGRGIAAVGELEGTSEGAVLGQLRAKGLIVLKVAEQKPTDVGDLFGRFKRVNTQELTVITRQLATMVNAGMPLLRSLYALEDQTEDKQLKATMTDIRKRIESGGAFSAALAQHPKVFDQLYVAMVQAGEKGGFLDKALTQIASQLEKSGSLKRQIRSAMMYPMLIGGFAFAVLIALVAFLVPVFEKVLKDFSTEGGELPFITKLSIGASHMITDRWYLMIFLTAGVVTGFSKWKRSKSGKAQWERFKLKIPFKIGKLIHKVALARFTRTFAGLTSSGVPVLETIEISGKTAGNVVIEEAMDKVREAVKTGSTIAKPIRESPKAFPSIVPHMIEIGEESGALDEMLDKIADLYEDEVTTAVKGLSSLLEPVMLIVIGGVVGFIVLSMYMPMFQVYDQIR